MAWWEILILIVVLVIFIPLAVIVWYAVTTTLIDNIKHRRIKKRITDTIDRISKTLSDTTDKADTDVKDFIRQDFYKDLEQLKREIKEVTKDDDNNRD